MMLCKPWAANAVGGSRAKACSPRKLRVRPPKLQPDRFTGFVVKGESFSASAGPSCTQTPRTRGLFSRFSEDSLHRETGWWSRWRAPLLRVEQIDIEHQRGARRDVAAGA